jgi:hypothetical protein
MAMAFSRRPAAAALLLLAAPSAEAFGATPAPDARTPFTFDVSGGGFRTMTAGMAFSRALSQAFEEVGGGWNDITHLTGNSGGQWFATQFAFGQEFFDQLTRREFVDQELGYKNMTGILEEWARGYATNVKAIHMEPFEPDACLVDSGSGPVDFAQRVKGLVDALTSVNLPVLDYEVYTSALVRAILPSIDTLTYDAPRPGLPNAALLQMMTVPPSVCINDSYQVYHPASFNSEGKALNLPLYHRAPAASSALAESSPGFFFPSAGNSNAALGFSPGYGPESANGPMVYMDFTSPTQTRVAEVMAISSAAGASIATRQTVEPFIRELVPDITDAGYQAALECMPLGLQSLAPPLTMQVVQGPSGSLEQLWAPTYRGSDGGFTDNSAMLNAISAMIADCEAGDASLRCAAKTFDIITVNDGNRSRPYDVGCYFNKTGCPPVGSTFMSDAGVLVPSTRIFLEDYPADQWIEYVPGWELRLGNGSRFNCSNLPEDILFAMEAAQTSIPQSGLPESRPPIVNATPAHFGTLLGQSLGIFDVEYGGSYATAGTFHTMDNDAWSIKGGYTVNLLLFEMNYPMAADPIIWPSDYAELAFHCLYAPIAEAQREGALPFLKQWLANRTITPV